MHTLATTWSFSNYSANTLDNGIFISILHVLAITVTVFSYWKNFVSYHFSTDREREIDRERSTYIALDYLYIRCRTVVDLTEC